MSILPTSTGTNWARILSGLGQGLMQAGGPQGFSGFGPGMMQGTQAYDDRLNAEQLRQMREQQMQIEQEQLDATKTANQDAAAAKKAQQDYINSLPPGMLSPQQQGFFQAFPDQVKTLGEQLFPKPNDFKPNVQDFYNQGNTKYKGYLGPDNQVVRLGPDVPMWEPKAPGSGDNSGVGLELFYTQDADGTLHAWQPSRTGQPVEVKLPDGQKFSPGVQYLNTGTAFVPADKRTGQVVGQAVPIDVAGQNAQQEIGTSTGKVVSGLPDAEAKAQEASDLIDRLKMHPGRQQATGLSSYLPAIAGSDAKDFNVQLDQLKGTVFLQAYSQLKGGGAITEVEGKKAEQAIARLDTAQSEGEFVKALDELDGIIKAGIARMRQRAGQPVAVPSAPALPPPPDGFEVVQ